MLETLKKIGKVGASFAIRAYGNLVHVKWDVSRQKRKLVGYDSDIQSVTQRLEASDGPFAIFVFYGPDGKVPADVTNALNALSSASVHVLLVSNHKLSSAQTKAFAPMCHSMIERGNQGFDMGAYRDALQWITAKGLNPDRLIFLNNSVYYSHRGLSDFFVNLLGPEDAVAAFENWGEGHHLQSFALSVSANILNAKCFTAFWDDYVPVNNRVHAIEAGERALSHAVLAAADSSRVIYSVAALRDRLQAEGLDFADSAPYLSQPINSADLKRRDELEGLTFTPEETAQHICDIISQTSLIHSGAYFFARYLECPIFKKDIVYRRRFKFWQVEQWLGEVMPDAADREAYLHLLRKRGDGAKFRGSDRIKYHLGVK